MQLDRKTNMINSFKFFQGRPSIISRYNTADLLIETVSYNFTVGVNNTPLTLSHFGTTDVMSITSMIDDLRNRYATCVSLSDNTLGYMEDFFNEHLNGTTTINYAY